MKKAYCLLNHPLTEKQKSELQKRFGAQTIEYPDDKISIFWAQIPVETEISDTLLAPVTAWLLQAPEGSPVIVQGQSGASFSVTDWCLNHKLIPLYAATRRISTEQRNGETIHKENLFEHISFMEYKRIS